jgi:hypothetical protein
MGLREDQRDWLLPEVILFSSGESLSSNCHEYVKEFGGFGEVAPQVPELESGTASTRDTLTDTANGNRTMKAARLQRLQES